MNHRRTLRAREPKIAGVFLAAALAVGILTGVTPVVAIGVIAVVAILITWTRPELGLIVLIASDAMVLLIQLSGINSLIVTGAAVGLPLVSMASMVSHQRGSQPAPLTAITVSLFGTLAVYGVYVGSGSLPLLQIMIGLKLLLLPVIALLCGALMTKRQLITVLHFGICIASFNAVVAGVQQAYGADRLLSMGLVSGTQVRTIDGALRASGTFGANYQLGAFAAVLLALSLVWMPSAVPELSRRWRLVATTSAMSCLLFSTYRAGVVLVAATVVLYLVFGGKQFRLRNRIFVILAMISIAGAFVRRELTSSASLDARFRVWDAASSLAVDGHGRGVGFTGAASGADPSFARVVTDNYFIALWLQFGYLGLFAVVGLAVVLGAGLLAVHRPSVVSAACILGGVLATFALVEFWEYTSATALALMVFGWSDAYAREGRSGVLRTRS